MLASLGREGQGQGRSQTMSSVQKIPMSDDSKAAGYTKSIIFL